MEFNRDVLQELASSRVGESVEDEGKLFTVKVNDVIGKRRWSIDYEMVFEVDGCFYEAFYSRGATETQDEAPFEYEGEQIECREVIPVEVVVTKYVSKEGSN